MRKRKDFANTFAAGEVDEEFDQIGEDLGRQSLRRGRNVALMNSGGVRRRPGSVRMAALAAEGVTAVYDFQGGFEHLVFTAGKVYILDEDGVELDDLVGPWTGDDLDNMQVELGEDGVDIVSQSFWPRVMERDADGVWTIAEKTFASGIGNGLRQPYFRYEPPGVSIQPSALTGSITVEFSEEILTSDWEGIRIRYLGQEIEIDTVTDGDTCAATVIQPLFPTITLDVAAGTGAGFQVGEVVQGSETSVRGLVTAVATDELTIVLLEGFTHFDDSTPENLIGPRATAAIVAASIGSASPAETTIWDEAMIGAHRGYPGAVTRHRKRLLYAGFPKAGSYIAASAIDRPNDFDVGSGEDNEAFIEGLGDDENANIRHLVSVEQLLVATDRSVYYVPESEQVPLTPTTVDFKWISDDGAAMARPVLSAEGAIFIGTSKRLLAVAPTGNVRASWRILDLSDLAYHLLTDPVELAIGASLQGDSSTRPRPERYVYVRNSDGTVAVLHYKRGAEIVGMCLWSRGGSDIWRSLYVFQNSVYVVARLQSSWQLERLDPDRTMDGEVDYATANTTYNGKTVHVAIDGHVFGSGLVSAGVNAAGAAGADRTMGVDFAVEMTPMPPLSRWVGHEIRRVSAWVYFRRRGNVRVAGILKPAHVGGDDLGAAPTLVTGSVREFALGWGEGNTIPVTQLAGEGAPMEIGSYTFDLVS